MKKGRFTGEQLFFLQNLNSILSKREQELFDRCKTIVELYEKRLEKNGGDLHDYEIEVVVEFYLAGGFPKYIFQTTINRKMLEEDDLTFGSNENWSEESFPELGDNWCYIMHCLYDHSGIGEALFKIIRVDFEINIREQQFNMVIDHEIFC